MRPLELRVFFAKLQTTSGILTLNLMGVGRGGIYVYIVCRVMKVCNVIVMLF